MEDDEAIISAEQRELTSSSNETESGTFSSDDSQIISSHSEAHSTADEGSPAMTVESNLSELYPSESLSLSMDSSSFEFNDPLSSTAHENLCMSTDNESSNCYGAESLSMSTDWTSSVVPHSDIKVILEKSQSAIEDAKRSGNILLVNLAKDSYLKMVQDIEKAFNIRLPHLF